MTVPTQTALEVPQTGLGAALGMGIQRGAQLGLQGFLKNFTLAQTARKKALEPFTASEMMKEFKGYGVSEEDIPDPKERQILLSKLNRLTSRVGRKNAIQQVAPDIDKYLTDEIDTAGEAAIQEDKFRTGRNAQEAQRQGSQLWQDLFGGGAIGRRGAVGPRPGERTLIKDLGAEGPFAKGIKSSSTGKLQAVISGESLKDYQKGSTLRPKADLWDKILYTIGNFTGETPAFIGGGAVGSVGGPIGTTAGAFAMPAFLNQSLTEFMRFKEQGGKGSFEDYLNAAGRVASETVKGGAAGAIFGMLGKVIPIMKAANPAMKTFFETTKAPRVKEFLGTGTLQSLGLVGAEAAAKRELPTKGEIAGTFATVFGLNLLTLGTNRAKGIIERIRRTKNPTKTIERVKAAADKTDIQREKLREGDPTEIKKMSRIVEDITKTEEAREKREKIKPEERITKEISTEKLEKRRAETKAEAERLAKAPLEEYLEEKVYKETPAMKVEKIKATKELGKIEAQKQKLEKNISQVREGLEKLNESIAKRRRDTGYKMTLEQSDQRQMSEKLLSNFEGQLEKLETTRKELEYIKRKGRKPFSEAEAKEAAKKHVKELQQMSKEPGSATALEWERKFDRDQKYIDQAIEILKRGEEPIAPYKDFYIKTLETYNDIYRNSLKDINTAIEASKGKEKAELQKIRNKLNRNLSINEGKLTKHRDKLASKEAIKQGSPIMRHFLRQLKGDLPGMTKPVIELRKATKGREAKISKVFEKKVDKTVQEIIKDPSTTKIENAIKEHVPQAEKEQARKEVKSVKAKSEKVYKNARELIAEGLKEGKSPLKMAKDLTGLLSGMSVKDYRNKLVRSIAGAILFGGIRKAIESKFGIKVPFSTLAFMLPIFKGMRFGAAAIGYVSSKILKGMMIQHHKKQYHALRTPTSRREYRLKLKNKNWGAKDIKEIGRK